MHRRFGPPTLRLARKAPKILRPGSQRGWRVSPRRIVLRGSTELRSLSANGGAVRYTSDVLIRLGLRRTHRLGCRESCLPVRSFLNRPICSRLRNATNSLDTGLSARSKKRPHISGQQEQTADEERPPAHLIGGSQHFPERMTSKSVVLDSTSEPRHQQTVLGRSYAPMVNANLARKGPCLPALHPCSNDRNMIHAPALNRHIAADLFETLAPEQLAETGNMLDADEAVVVGLNRAVLEWCSHQP